MTGLNIHTDNNSFTQANQDEEKSQEIDKNAIMATSENQVVKSNRNPEKQTEPATNNYYTLFTDQEKVIQGNIAAVKHKYNKFSILSGTRLRSFKFDHIINTGEPESEPEQEGQPPKSDNMGTYIDVEVERFLHHNKNLIYVNMTDDVTEKFPINIPDFPKKFYDKCKLILSHLNAL